VQAASLKAETYAKVLWDQAEQKVAVGQRAYDSNDFSGAKQAWSQAKDGYTKSRLSALERIGQAKGEAVSAKGETEAARVQAASLKAETYAKVLWDQAEQKVAVGQRAYDSNDFGGAKQAWSGAKDGYNKAGGLAQEAVQAINEQRAACDRALSIADSARKEALSVESSRYASDEWAQAEQSYERGCSCLRANEFDGALVALQQARDLYITAGLLGRLVKAEIDYNDSVLNAKPKRLPEIQGELATLVKAAQDAKGRGDYDAAIGVYTKAIGLLRAIQQYPSQRVLTLREGVTLSLVLVEPGEFDMGAPSVEEGSRKNEWTVHRVKITRPFYLGRYEVTQTEYQAVTGVDLHSPKPERDPLPAVNVSWDDAQEFCQKVTRLTGGRCHLPTEAQWEYACRAGTSTPYCNGTSLRALKKVGWCSYDGKTGSAGRAEPVGRLDPNRWGLYDMHGNVWEWCQDWYGEYSHLGVSDPPGPETGTQRVVRGGGWYTVPSECRCATRQGLEPSTRESSLGFRIACEID